MRLTSFEAIVNALATAQVRFVSMATLIRMKEQAGRQQLRRWSRLPLRQVILALEEMEEISKRLADAPSK